MNLDELWIGDKVQIIKSGKRGLFEGVNKAGKARVNVNNKILLVQSDNITIQKETELEIDPSIDDIQSYNNNPTKHSNAPQRKFTSEIDLHINKLNPDIANEHAQLILDHQLVMCRAFISDAISRKKNVVTVVHGKGKGVLKEEVLHLLKEYSAVRFAIEVNDGGAQEVWFRY